MNLLKAPEFKVGLLVLGVATLIAYMSMQVSDDPSYIGRSNEAWFLISDAGGLVKGSSVKMAGITMGIIKDITLRDGQARVDMTMRSDVKLFVSASVEIKAQGILGDKHVEILPGSPNDPQLPRGGQILTVKDKGSLDNVVAQVGEIATSLKSVAQNIKEAVADDGTRKHVLGRIVLNVEQITADLAQMTTANKDKLGEIITRVQKISKTLDEALNSEGDEGFRKTWKRTLARIDSTMKNIDEITGKINKGEGTIGRLVNDEQTIEEINTAVEGINGYLDTAGKTQTGIDFHADYLGSIGMTKSSVGLKIQPGLDRYYLLGIVDDPAGVVETIDTTTKTTATSTSQTEIKTYHNKIKFNALFAKNFFNFTIKGGLMENTGGLGVDYFPFGDKFHFSLDAYEFSKLNLRAQVQYNFYKGLFLNSGVSDILNNSQKNSVYVGMGLLITNDDMKMLLSKMPL